MSLCCFQQLSPAAQLCWVFTCGTCLAQRWVEAGGVTLYHCADAKRGFFVEVCYHEVHRAHVVLRSFSDSQALAEYAHEVRLPAQ